MMIRRVEAWKGKIALGCKIVNHVVVEGTSGIGASLHGIGAMVRKLRKIPLNEFTQI